MLGRQGESEQCPTRSEQLRTAVLELQSETEQMLAQREQMIEELQGGTRYELESAMTCIVCLTAFNCHRRRPRVLPCGHTFCGMCTKKLRKQLCRHMIIVQCPVCRDTHPFQCLEDIPVNHLVEDIVRVNVNGSPENRYQEEETEDNELGNGTLAPQMYGLLLSTFYGIILACLCYALKYHLGFIFHPFFNEPSAALQFIAVGMALATMLSFYLSVVITFYGGQRIVALVFLLVLVVFKIAARLTAVLLSNSVNMMILVWLIILSPIAIIMLWLPVM